MIADVIVVGGGAAGLCAASAAASLGCRVLLLEKNESLGGTTALAVGSIMGAGTRMQRRAGIVDSAENHEDDLARLATLMGLTDNVGLRRLLTQHGGETVDFLESIGIDFVGPFPQPHFDVPRMHQALPGARSYVYRLRRHCRRLGVSIRTNVRALRLDFEGGRVQGVEVLAAGSTEVLKARFAVILATGDFASNLALRNDWMGAGGEDLQAVNPTATGDGQLMGREIGAKVVLRPDLGAPRGTPRFSAPPLGWMDRLPPWRCISFGMKLALQYLPSRWARPFVLRAALTALAVERAFFEGGAVLVNRRGDRFTDELGAPAVDLARQPQGEAFVVFDHSLATRFSAWPHFVSTAPGIAFAYVDDYKRARPDLYHEAPDIASLAQELGMESGRLATALSDRAQTSRDVSPTGPYHALGPIKAWLVLTPVGLSVNCDLQALDAGGNPIDGLFAAGGVGQGGLSILGHGHGLGWACTSGRLAGRNAARAIST